MSEEVIIINDEPFYRIQNGTSYDYAPIPKQFKPYFDKLQQENKQLKNRINKAVEYIESKNNGVCIVNGVEKGAYTFVLDFDKARKFIWKLLDLLKGDKE